MRKWFFLAILIALPAALHGQVIVGNYPIQYVNIAPSGSCTPNAPAQLVMGPGTLYTCQNGTWAVAGGGGSGSGGGSGAGSPTVAVESNKSVPYTQPATGVSTAAGVACFGEGIGAVECGAYMTINNSTNMQNTTSGNFTTLGNYSVADVTNNFFKIYSPSGTIFNPAVILRTGLQDGQHYGHAGDGNGGTGTKMGFLKFADAIATWAAMSPMEKRPATLYPFTTQKVTLTGNTVVLTIEPQRNAMHSLTLNQPILLNGFTQNTGLNGKVWHIQTRSDQTGPSTQLVLTEPCTSGCITASEVGTITLAYWTPSGFAQDTSFGIGERINQGNPGMITSTPGATLTSNDPSSYDSIWIGPQGLLLLWYYSYAGGTGTFTVNVNGVDQTDYFTGVSTIPTEAGSNPGNALSGPTNPYVALAAFTGLPPNSFAKVIITAVSASTGIGQVGVIATGSPMHKDSAGGAAGSPNIVWSGLPEPCTSATICPIPVSDTSGFYNDVILAEAVRLGSSVANGGWGLNVRPADIRSSGNNGFDYLDPGVLPTNWTIFNSYNQPQAGVWNNFKATARAMGLSASSSTSGQFYYNGAIGVTDYTGISCSSMILIVAAPSTSETLPACQLGKIFLVQNSIANSTFPLTALPIKNTDGTTAVTLYNGEWALLFAGTLAGSYLPIFQSSGTNKLFDRLIQSDNNATTGSANYDNRFRIWITAGQGISFANYTGTSAIPGGTLVYIKNKSIALSAAITGMSGGDLPPLLGPGQSILAITNGGNLWWNFGNSTTSLGLNQNAYTATHTLVVSDAISTYSSASVITVNIPGNWGSSGPYILRNIGTANVTLAPISSAVFVDVPTTLAPNQSITIYNNLANWYLATNLRNTATGVATLVAGAVTVAATQACTPGATCLYQLTNCGVIGTPGILSVGTITAGTSFVINSSNGADTSKVCWRVN